MSNKQTHHWVDRGNGWEWLELSDYDKQLVERGWTIGPMTVSYIGDASLFDIDLEYFKTAALVVDK